MLLAISIGMNIYLIGTDGALLRKGYADFTIFYSAARIVRSGDAHRLYDAQTQFRVQRAIAPDVDIRQAALPYNHPPVEALLFVPLTFLPYFTAYIAWGAVNLVMLALAMWILRRRAPGLHLPTVPMLGLLAAGFFPIFMNFFQGQDEVLLLLLTVLVYVAFKGGSEFSAGLWLGLGSFRPQIVVPLALILLCSRKLRLTCGFLCSAAMLAIVSACVVGWHQILLYPKYVWELERNLGGGAIVPAAMPNLRGLISAFLPDGHAAAVGLTACCSIVILAWAVRLLRSAERQQKLEIGFAAALLASVLVSYHALIYDLGVLFLSVLLLYPFVRPSSEGALARSQWMLWLPAGCLFFAPLQMTLWLGVHRLNWMSLLLLLWMFGIARAAAESAAVIAEAK